MTDINDNQEVIASLIKGLKVIKSFDIQNSSMTLSDIAKKNEITRASARRIIRSLMYLDYVDQTNNFFSLTPKIIELGYSYFSSLHWTDMAYKEIKKIVDKCKLSCSILTLDGVNAICIMRVPSTRVLNEALNVGMTLPAAYTATGRVFMMHMDDNELYKYVHTLPITSHTDKSITSAEDLYKTIKSQRNQGYQLVVDELEEGFASMAVPIFNRENKVMATISIATYLSYKNIDYLKGEVLPLLRVGAANVGQAINALQK